jgi:hypothetical protein
MRSKTKIVLIFIGLSFLSCKKEGYVNLEATLTSDTKRITAIEGDPLIINITLDKELSEPLVLRGTVFPDYGASINASDYENKIEYSTDFGKTWHTNRSGLSVEIPANSKQFKLRIVTNEDTDYEVLLEGFTFVLEKAGEQDLLTLSGMPLYFQMEVIDNEAVERSNDDAIMKIIVDDDQSHRVVVVTERLKNIGLKFVLDEKKHLEFLEKAVFFTNRYFDDTHDIRQFEINEDLNTAGYVYNNGIGTENAWGIGLSPFVAYIKFNLGDDGITAERKPYNFNGNMGYTLVHEAGHIVSLTNGIDLNNNLSGAQCGFIDLYNRCFVKDSWVTAFYRKFYNIATRQTPILPEFVTEYAATNIAEDLAETLAVYTLLDSKLPPLTESSSTALQKLHFIGQQQEVKPFAEYMVKSEPYYGEITLEKAAKNRPYLYKNRFSNKHKGKVIDCQTAAQLFHKKQND